MIQISRLWNFSDSNLKPDIDYLYKRPRIDFRVSEYIYNFINKELLTPNNIMQKGDYEICLSLQILDSNKHKFFYNTPYNIETTKFRSSVKNRKDKGRTYKAISILQ